MAKRLLALLLTLVMVLQPVLPAAAEAVGEDIEVTEATEETVEVTEGVTEETTEEPTEEVTEEATEEPTEGVSTDANETKPLSFLGADYEDESLVYHYNVAASAGDTVALHPATNVDEDGDIAYQWMWFDPVQEEYVELFAEEGITEQSPELRILVQEHDFENTLYMCKVEIGHSIATAIFHFVKREEANDVNSEIATYEYASYTLEVGKTKQLSVSQRSPVPGSQSWRSSNSTVVKIESSGTLSCNIRAITTGTANITCNYAYLLAGTSFRTTDTFKITVTPSTTPHLRLSTYSLSLKTGQSSTIGVEVENTILAGAYGPSFVSIVQVANGFRVTGIAPGSGNIEITAGSLATTGVITKTCHIEVTGLAISGKCGTGLSWQVQDDSILTISGKGEMNDYTASTVPWKGRNDSIKKVIVESGVTSIGDYAFSDFGKLETVTLPESLKHIGKDAFSACGQLGNVYYHGHKNQWDAIQVEDGNNSLTKAILHPEINIIYVGVPEKVKNPNPSKSFCGEELQLQSLSRTGYIFDGWYKENNLKTKVGSIPADNTQDVTLYAKWTAIHYTLSFNLNGSTGTIPDMQLEYDETGTLPSEGFSFTGSVATKWTTSKDGSGKSYSLGQQVSNLSSKDGATIVLYAQWRPIAYQISFESNGGTGTPENRKVSYGESFRLPDAKTVTRDLYSLSGWTAVIDGIRKTYQPGDEIKITSDADGATVTFRAQWVPDYGTVSSIKWSLDKNGLLTISGTGKMPDFSSAQSTPWDKNRIRSLEIGNEITYIGMNAFSGCAELVEVEIPTSVELIGSKAFSMCTKLAQVSMYSGVTSIGENAFQGCSSLEIVTLPDTLEKIGRSAFADCGSTISYLYAGSLAQWGTVTYDSADDPLTHGYVQYRNGSKYSYMNGQCGSTASWKLLPDGTLRILGSGEVIAPANISGEAYWTAGDVKYAIVDVGITKIGGSVFKDCTALVEIRLPVSLMTIGDDAFIGCMGLKSIRYSGKQEQWDAITIASGNEALANAKLLLSTYMLSYKNVDGATNPNPNTADKDRALTLKDATRTGYLFGGWYKEDSFKTKVTSIPAGNEADVTLYAKWTPISYTVSFGANGGTGSIAKKTVSYGELVELPKTGFSRTGYTFTGWNTKTDGKGTAYTLGQTVTNLSSTQGANVTLYAQWKANSYQVIFNLNGGTGKVDSISTVYDTTCTLPKTAPAWTGYTLTGWNTKADGTGTAYALGAQVKNLTAASGGKVTLYAVWKANTYSIRFYSNDGTQNSSLQSDLSYGMEYTLNANSFQWKGRVFLGWAETASGTVKYADSAKVKDLTAENGATVNLYAQWRLVTYQVTYDANGGEGKLENQQVTYGDTFRLPGAEALTRDLYSFSGWTASIGEETKTYQPGQELKDLTEADGAIIVFQAVWAPNFGTIGKLEWALHNDGLLTVSGTGKMPDYSAAQAAPWAKVKIRKIQIGEGITYIGSQAFSGCKNLAEVALPGSLEGIGAGAFQGCGNDLIYRYAGSLAQWGEVSYQVADDPTASGVVLYESTKYMNGTCGNASWKLQTDGTLRFSGTGAAKAPDSEVHWSLEDVHSVTVEDGITELGANLVRDCAAMTTVTLPRSLTAIGTGTFAGCTGLKTVRYSGKQEQWDAITIYKGNEALTNAALLLSTYIITYVNTEGAENPNPVTADKEQALVLQNPKRTGYIFDGWYKDANFQTKMTSIPAGNEDDVTLYAKWVTRLYFIEFHSNSGSGKMDDQAVWYDAATSLSKNKFTRKGYTFAGWSLIPGEEAAMFQDEERVLNLGDGDTVYSVDLYAQWTPIEYSLTLDTNGGIGAPEKVILRYGTPYTLPTAQEVRKDGFALTGWTGKIGSSKKTYRPGAELKDLTTVEGTEVTLTAQWGPCKYTVRFEPGEGTGKAKTQAMTYGKAAALTTNGFKRPGYTFDGWLAEDGTAYGNKESVMNLTAEPNGVVTLTAQWRPVAYRIVFDVNGGTGEVPGSGGYYTCGITYTIPQSDLTRQGYRFIGWSTKKGGKVAYQEGSSVKDLATTEGKAVTLYAVWQAERYQLHFDANGGTGSTTPMLDLTSGKSVTLRANSFRKPGYKFTGWNTEPDGSGTAYKDKAKVKLNVDSGMVVLYAQWEQIHYTVTYKNVPVGSEGGNPNTYTIEEGLQLKDGFVRGMTFEGWYLDAKFKTRFDSIAPGGDARNVTVYAKLSGYSDTFFVDYYGNGADNDDGYITDGIGSKTLYYSKAYTLRANTFKRAGYKFLGWSQDASAKVPEYKDKQTVSNLQPDPGKTFNNVSLYAVWEPIQYTVTYKGVTADEIQAANNVISFNVLDSVDLQDPTRPGCTFLGWYTESNFKTYIYRIIGIYNTRNLTLYAKWTGTPVKYAIAYNGNGATSGNMKVQNTSCGKEVALTKNAFKRPGYTFLGWSTDPKATEPEFTNKQKVSNLRSTGGTVMLYAVWEAIPYTVTLKNIGGAAIPGVQNGVLEYTAAGRDLPIPVLPGAKFAGWYTTANFKDGTQLKELKTGATGNKILYAKWQIQ